MYFQKRGDTYSFIFYDSTKKKNVRLPQSQTPKITNDDEAKKFCDNWDAKYDSERQRIQTRLAWKFNYHNFAELAEKFQRSRLEEAPNTAQDAVGYLENYVLPFFLDEKKENNLNAWYWHFEDFRDHLLEVKLVRGQNGNKTPSFSTKNNIILVLNAFMKFCYRRHLVDKEYKCRLFASSNLGKRNVASVIEPDIAKAIFSKLEHLDRDAGELFQVLLHTGLRINEALGLSLADFFDGEIEAAVLKKAMEPYSMKPHGYLVIDSQPRSRHRIRDEHGHVPRKPLKGKKSIDPEDCRIIPILDATTHRILQKRWDEQAALYKQGEHGIHAKNYLLFDGETQTRFRLRLLEAQKFILTRKAFTPHDLRHTYSTWLAEQTGGNYTLCRLILGHTDINITMRYVHIHAKLHREMTIQSRLRLLKTPATESA